MERQIRRAPLISCGRSVTWISAQSRDRIQMGISVASSRLTFDQSLPVGQGTDRPTSGASVHGGSAGSHHDADEKDRRLAHPGYPCSGYYGRRGCHHPYIQCWIPSGGLSPDHQLESTHAIPSSCGFKVFASSEEFVGDFG